MPAQTQAQLAALWQQQQPRGLGTNYGYIPPSVARPRQTPTMASTGAGNLGSLYGLRSAAAPNMANSVFQPRTLGSVNPAFPTTQAPANQVAPAAAGATTLPTNSAAGGGLYPGGLTAQQVAAQANAPQGPRYAPGGLASQTPISAANLSAWQSDPSGANDPAFQAFPFFHDPLNQQEGYQQFLIAQQNGTLDQLLGRETAWQQRVAQAQARNAAFAASGTLPPG